MSLWARIFGAPRPPSPRLAELAERVEDAEHALRKLAARVDDGFEAIGARITNKLRRQKAQEDAGEAVEGSDDGEGQGVATPRRSVVSTAFLARRFRIGG
jgi:hypothetical protein